MPAKSPIRVKFAINQDGRLGVSATHRTMQLPLPSAYLVLSIKTFD